MKRIYRGFKTDCPTGICLDLCFYNKCYGLGFISSMCNIYHKSYTKHIWIWRVGGPLLQKWWWGWAKSSRVHLFFNKCIVIRKLSFVCTSTIYMIYDATITGLVTEDIFYSIFSKFFPLGGDTYNGTWKFFKHLWKRVISFVCRIR